MTRSIPLAGALCLLFVCGLAGAQGDGSALPTIPVQSLGTEATTPARFERLRLTASNTLNEISLQGYVQLDNDFYDGAYNQRGNGGSSENEIRRARFGVEGTLEGGWSYDFLLNVDDDEQTADVDTASIRYAGEPWAAITAGRFKRPVGLEVLTSAKWSLTDERAIIFEAIPHNDVSQFGLMLDGALSGFHYYLGIFDANVEDIQTGEDQYGLYARLTYADVSQRGNVLHLGLSAADQKPDDRTPTTVASRFGVHTLPSDRYQFVNELNPNRTRASVIEVNKDRQAGVEFATVLGPVTIQAEVLGRDLALSAGRNVQVRGGYLAVAWALTGQRRRYNADNGTFGNILGAGDAKRSAWELVAKVDHVEARKDADAKVTLGTLGLIWTPNLNLRFLVDYLRFKSDGLADGDDFQDEGSAVNARMQFHF